MTSGGDEGASKPKESLGYHSSLLANAIYVKSTKGIFTSDQKTYEGEDGEKKAEKIVARQTVDLLSTKGGYLRDKANI